MRALVLGYTADESRICAILSQKGFDVVESSNPVVNLADYDLTVSFGYRHLISSETLASASGRVLNLHISYLPFNRGAHPLFWACFNNEPTGVTIHQIDDGLDTGPVFAQKKVEVPQEKISFRQAHALLKASIEDLFEGTIPAILDSKVEPKAQGRLLPAKKKKDLPSQFRGWDSIIGPEIERLRSIKPTEET